MNTATLACSQCDRRTVHLHERDDVYRCTLCKGLTVLKPTDLVSPLRVS